MSNSGHRTEPRGEPRPSLCECLDAMAACLANNSPEARRGAQFRNTMESLIYAAREAANAAVEPRGASLPSLPEWVPKGDPTKWRLSEVIQFARWALVKLA